MIHSFLLIGQSNMAGRGSIDEAIEFDTRRVKIMRNGRWLNMFRPINPDRRFSGVNLAESFAAKYANKHNVDVGLICCADGGTSLDQWKKGSILFDNAVYQGKLAKRTSHLAGVLWHQGEADCAKELYTTYSSRFEEFMNDLRNELDLHNVPFLLGGLGDFLPNCGLDEHLKNYMHLNDALKSVAKNNPMTGFVRADGLGANADNLHFNSKALYDFGLRYFDVFEKFETQVKPPVEIEEDKIQRDMELL